ncbi:alpha/beta hydrolase [Amycolatopsis acidiphila]|uniref:alpha/beta fold hydrolase n=1 Tax=Amycolatopsis acidiphila TaxID=715473 RepID=UPI001643B456|nr:alpha/beta hydrolase [Amycolatopsis acidiphila]UIJ57815.1 alpha/beta hydrolase [Amycolatopsis acidiphila]GHG87834.1 alpha/beta hydrolase [Amycolatopsis acidiphila]
MTELAAERWGDSGPPIVLVHGSLSSAAAAFSEQRVLAEKYRLIAPYRRGYSPSPSTDRIDPDRDAEEIVELLGDGAHLVGTSMGGVVSMRAAALAPEKVWSLTVIEPPAMPNAAGRPEADKLIEGMRKHWAEHGSDDLESFAAGFLKTLNVSMDLPSPLPPPFAEAVGNLKTERPWETGVPLEKLAAAGFPKLVVTGGGTPGFEDVADVLAERLPAKRVRFDGSPHAVQKIGEKFNTELLDFLSSAGEHAK